MLPVQLIGKMHEYQHAEENEEGQRDKMHRHPFSLGNRPVGHSHPDILKEREYADPGTGDIGDDIQREQLRYVL